MQQLNTRTVSPQSDGSIGVHRDLRLGATTGPQPLELEPHGQGMIDVLPRKPLGLIITGLHRCEYCQYVALPKCSDAR